MKRTNPNEEPYVRILLYGKPGSTKTRTAYTAALDDRTWPTLVLNVAGNPFSTRDYARHPDILELEELSDLNPVYDWIQRGQPAEHPLVKNFGLLKDGPYKCLIIDQITETQRYSFKQVTGNVNVGPGSHGARVGRQEFGAVLDQMVRFASLYFQLPLHVIMCAQEKTEKDEQTGSITIAPYLWGQSDVEVGSYAYVVARLVHRSVLPAKSLSIMEDVNDDTVSVALFKPSGKYDAKDQYGKLGDYMVDPSITKMLDLIGK